MAVGRLDALYEDLRSPDPIIRFSVISRIESLNLGPEDIRKLADLSRETTDDKLRFYLKILASRGKPSTDDDLAEGILGIEELLAQPEPDFFRLLLELKRLGSDKTVVLGMLRDFGLTRFPNEVLPHILIFFMEHGSKGDVPHIEEFCRSSDPVVLTAAVEAIEKLNPSDLKTLLVPLLVNSMPGIRSRAIRVLYKWDPREALRHFEAMLFSEDPVERQAALFHAFFFPFSKIEAFCFKFFSLENEPALLRRAGQLFIINPSFASAMHLTGVFELSGGEKREIVKETLLGVVDFLSKAKLTEKSPSETLKDLKEAYRKRKIAEAVSRQEICLKSEKTEVRRQAVLALGSMVSRGITLAGETLEKYRDMPEYRDLIDRTLKGDPENGRENQPLYSLLPEISHKDFLARSEDFQKGFEEAGQSDKQLYLQRLQKFNDRSAVPFLTGLLDSSAPELVARVIETLSQLAPDAIKSRIDFLLLLDEPEVTVNAIKALFSVSPWQAMVKVEQLLFSPQPSRRKMGIFSAGSLDFLAVKAVVLKGIMRETDGENLELYKDIISANIDRTLLLEISTELRAHQAPMKDLLNDFLQELASRLIKENGESAVPPSPLEEQDSTAKEYSVAATRIQSSRVETVSSGRTEEMDSYLLKNSGETEKPWRAQSARPRGMSRANSLRVAKGGACPPLLKSYMDSFFQEFQRESQKGLNQGFLFLRRASNKALSESNIDEFLRLIADEKDPGTNFHLREVLEQWKLQPPPEKWNPLLSLTQALEKTPTDFLQAAVALENTGRRDVGTAYQLLVKNSWEKFPVEVLPFVLAFLKRAGKPEVSPEIVGFCLHEDPRVAMAAAEALEKINPDEIRPLFVPLLTNGCPIVRSLGIRMLYRYDQSEAVKHFEANLFSADLAEKDAALHHAYFLPFSIIEPFLVRFLYLETDLELLEKAGYLFKVNPIPEEPKKLISIWENCVGEKRNLIGKIVTTVVEFLSKSGIIQKAPEVILKEIKAEYRSKKVHLPQEPSREKDDRAGEELAGALPERLSGDKLVAWLSLLSETDFQKHKRVVWQKLSDTEPSARAQAARVIGKFGGAGEREKLTKLLADEHAVVILAGVESLLENQPELLHPFLAKLTGSSFPEVREAAMRAWVMINSREALDALEQIMGSKKPRQRGDAIKYSDFFEFSPIKGLLISVFVREDDGENIVQFVKIFEKELTCELLIELSEAIPGDWRIETASKGKLLDQMCGELASKFSDKFSDKEAVYKWLARESENKKAQREKPTPPYALSNIQRIRSKSASAKKPGKEESRKTFFGQEFSQKQVSAIVAGVLVFFFAALYFIFQPADAPQIPAVKDSRRTVGIAKPVKPGEPFVVDKVVAIQGVITQVRPGGLEVRLDGPGGIFNVRFPGPIPRYPVGAPFRAKVKMRSQADAVISTELISAF